MNRLARALQFFRPEADRLAVVTLLMGLSLGANLLKPWPMALIVDCVLGTRPVPVWLRSLSGPAEKGVLLLVLCVCLLFLHLARSGFSAAQHYLSIQAGLSGLQRVRNELFAVLQRLSLRFHQGTRGGELSQRAAWDTCAFQTLFQQGVVTSLTALCSLVGMVVVMWRLNLILALVSLTVVPLLLLVMKRFAGRLDDRSQAAQQADSMVTTFVQQSIATLPLIQSYTRESYEEGAFTRRTAAAMEKRLAQHGGELRYWLAVAVVFALGATGLAWFGGKQVLNGRLSLGELLVFVSYLAQFYEPVHQLSHVGNTVSNASLGIQRVYEILDTPEEVRDNPDARPVTGAPEGEAEPAQARHRRAGTVSPTIDPRALICRGEIEFEHVAFGYQKGEPVLQDVSFGVQPGEVVALLGPGGAGKTTLLHLLPRFFDPTGGVVRLDGVDLRDLRVRDLRRQMALVLQEAILLPASIAENIAYGKPRAGRREIEAAATAAGANAFIEKLPNGYATIVGEAGTRLNMGQRHRLNLARAFLKDAPILLLDEPSGALDAGSEAQLVASLLQLMRGRTTLMVAHRLATAQRADRILVLDQGRLVEEGTPGELAARASGHFARLTASQAGLS